MRLILQVLYVVRFSAPVPVRAQASKIFLAKLIDCTSYMGDIVDNSDLIVEFSKISKNQDLPENKIVLNRFSCFDLAL